MAQYLHCHSPDVLWNRTDTFDTTWSNDASYHWHAASCEHKNEVADKAEHTLDWTLPDEENSKQVTCEICGYLAGRIEKTYEDYGEYKCKVITEYDSAGNKIKETVYNPDGSVADGYICDYEYNSNDKVVKFTKYDSNGVKLMHYEAAAGNYFYVLIYPEYDVHIWESDSSSKKVKEAYYTPTGSADFIANFADPNYPLDFTKFNSDGSVNYTYRYEYDSENKPFKITEKKDGVEVFQYEADPGNYIEVWIDSLHGWIEAVDEYDSDGVWIKRTVYNPDGTINTNPD